MTPIIAWRLAASQKAPGKFINLNASGQAMCIDPTGAITWVANDDSNYLQCGRNGLALEFQPGGDQNPNAPIFVVIPS